MANPDNYEPSKQFIQIDTWPEGMLFKDDPKAIQDHGSRSFLLSYRRTDYSYTGNSSAICVSSFLAEN